MRVRTIQVLVADNKRNNQQTIILVVHLVIIQVPNHNNKQVNLQQITVQVVAVHRKRQLVALKLIIYLEWEVLAEHKMLDGM